MKHLIDKILIGLSFAFVTGCSTTTDVAPSENESLNSISKSNAGKKESYFLQNQFDYFVDDELTPAIEKDKEIQEKYMDKSVDEKSGEVTYKDREDDYFTIQEVFDKVGAYMRANPSDHSKSNVTKINSMPAIGTTRKR